MLKNRVRELRKARGWTLEELAAEAGLSVSQVSRIEKNERGWSPDSLEGLAKAFGLQVIDLFDAAKAWQDAAIIGVVGERGLIKPCTEKRADKLKVKAPAAFGELLAIRVRGEHLYPRHLDGETIFCTKETEPTNDCVGRECLLWLQDGTSIIRIVHTGSKPGHFNLISHNYPPLYDQVVISCRPVVYIAPKIS